jgi:hypothetical protein
MNNESLRTRHSLPLATIILILLFAICSITALAQSGRRAPKSPSVPAATPEPSPTPTAKKSLDKPALPLIVGIDRQGLFANIPLYFYDTVLQSCADRLRDEPSVSVQTGSRDVSRGEAVKRAKAEKEGYVVLLDLRVDAYGGSSNADLSQIYIEYFIFAPQTAKQVSSGRVYQQAYRNRGGIPFPTSGRGNASLAEYRLKQAARDAAERILGAVHVSPSPGIPRPQP